MNQILAIVLCGIMGLTRSFAAEIEPKKERGGIDHVTKIEEMVKQALEAFQIPGAAIGVIVDGKVILSKGYGFRNQELELPVTENTLFAIGSCTNAFTTALLGQLVDEGKVAWDDPVVKYIPEFRLKDEYATFHTTLRDLVTHQSGLPRHDLLWYHSDLKRKDLLSLLPHLEPTADLRSKFQYNSIMYGVAGLVIEKVTDDTWEENISSRILAPLGMRRSNCSIRDSQNSDDFSLPYREKNGVIESIPFNNIALLAPAGAINSTVADMIKWVGLQLSEGKELLKKETLREIHSPQVVLRSYPDDSSSLFGYGLGWFTGMHQGRYLVAHNGGIDGFISSVAFLPKEKIGVVILTNSISSFQFADDLALAVLNQTLGTLKEDWLVKAKEKEKAIKLALEGTKTKGPAVAAGFSRSLKDYVGEYEHPAYGTAHVKSDEEGLVLSYHNIPIPLSHSCYDHFNGIFNGPYFEIPLNCSFVSDPFGAITELSIPVEPTLSPIPFKRKVGSELVATDYLIQFEGVFENELFPLKVVLKGEKLIATLPGADEYALIPEKPFQFSLKGSPGSSIRFIANEEGKISAMQFMTSNGTMNFKLTSSF